MGDYNWHYTRRENLQNVDVVTMANLVANVFEWNNRYEMQKLIQMCIDIYYPKMLEKKCWITDILTTVFQELGENNTTKYLPNHEYFQDITPLNVVIECIIENKIDVSAVDMNKRCDFLIYTLAWMINDECLLMYSDYADHNAPKFEALHQCITDKNDPLYQTYGKLCKQLISNIFKMFDNNACIFHGKMAKQWDMLDDNIDESVQLMNKIVVACQETV